MGGRAALPLPTKHVVLWRHAEAMNTPTSQLTQRTTLNHEQLPGDRPTQRDDYDDDDHYDDHDHDEKGGDGDDDNHDDKHDD